MNPSDLLRCLDQVEGVRVRVQDNGLFVVTTDGLDDQWEPLPRLLLDPSQVRTTFLGVGPNGQHLQLEVKSKAIIVASGDFAYEPVPQPDFLSGTLPIHVQGLPWLVSWTEAHNQLSAALRNDGGNFDQLTGDVLTSAAFVFGALKAGLLLNNAVIDQFDRLVEQYSQM